MDSGPEHRASSRRSDWAAACKTLTPRLVVWVRLRLSAKSRGSIDANDVVQAVWLRLYATSAQDSPAPSPQRVFTVAKYVLLEALRSARKLPSFGDGRTSYLMRQQQLPADATSIVESISKAEAYERISTRVAAWEETDRNVFRLLALEQLTQSEAAAQLGLSRDAVAKRWQRMLTKLRSTPGLETFFG